MSDRSYDPIRAIVSRLRPGFTDRELSLSQLDYRRTGTCPQGHYFLGMAFLRTDGRPISKAVPYALMPNGAYARCRRCNSQWPIFSEDTLSVEGPSRSTAAPSSEQEIEGDAKGEARMSDRSYDPFRAIISRLRSGSADRELSASQLSYRKTRVCPHGHYFLGVAFLRADGRPISKALPYSLIPNGAYARCRRCDTQWPIFSDDTLTFEEPSDSRVATIVATETARTPEYIGDDTHIIDGSASAISARSTIRASRRWRHAYQINKELARSVSGDAGLANFLPITLSARLDQTIKNAYSLETEEEQVFEQSIELDVPARTKLIVTLRWKRIWQDGYLVITQGTSTVEVPYRVAVQLSYDQTLQT
jgi:hypothetical protein